MRRFLLAVFVLFVLSPALGANDINDAEVLLKTKIDQILEVLDEDNLEIQDKKNKVSEIITPLFDFSLMAKLTLGRKYWPGLNEVDRERFTDLFVKRFKGVYLDKITLYTKEKVVFEPSVQKKTKVHVPTYLLSNGKKIAMTYKFYKSKNSWKIYDIEVEGVSLIQSYRSQFSSILETGTVDDLLKKMDEPAKS